MNLKKTITFAALAVAVALPVMAAPPVAHKTGRLTTTYSYTNETGRPILIESILVSSIGTALTNEFAFILNNSQNISPAGATATNSVISYTLGTASFTGSSNIVPSAPYMVPSGSVLVLTNSTAGNTNDFIMVLDEVQ